VTPPPRYAREREKEKIRGGVLGEGGAPYVRGKVTSRFDFDRF